MHTTRMKHGHRACIAAVTNPQPCPCATLYNTATTAQPPTNHARVRTHLAFSRRARLASQEVLRLAFVLRKMVEALCVSMVGVGVGGMFIDVHVCVCVLRGWQTDQSIDRRGWPKQHESVRSIKLTPQPSNP